MRRALLIALLLSGCAQILDLQDRSLDPTLGQVDAGAIDGATSLMDGSPTTTDAALAGRGATCEEYCSLASELCTADKKVQLFQTPETCLAVCAKYAVDSTSSRNTLSCRLNLLRGLKATGSNEALSTCPGAGPGGGPPPDEVSGVNCGTNCEGFCALRAATCPVMVGDVNCVQKCAALLDKEVYNAGSDFGGGQDTLSCRLAHLSAATYYGSLGMNDVRDAHCSHSGIRSEVQCDFKDDLEPDCESYCKIVGIACTGSNAVYESNAQCLEVCKAMEPGKTGDTTATGSRRCFRSGAYDALEGLANACPRASIAGDGCLGGRCASYCFFAKKACGDAFKAKYPSDTLDECERDCNGKPGAAANSPYSIVSMDSGDSIICKLKQLTRAMGGTGDVATECRAALGLASPCN